MHFDYMDFIKGLHSMLLQCKPPHKQYHSQAEHSELLSRLTIVSHKSKKKQAVRDEQASYLHVAPL